MAKPRFKGNANIRPGANVFSPFHYLNYELWISLSKSKNECPKIFFTKRQFRAKDGDVGQLNFETELKNGRLRIRDNAAGIDAAEAVPLMVPPPASAIVNHFAFLRNWRPAPQSKRGASSAAAEGLDGS